MLLNSHCNIPVSKLPSHWKVLSVPNCVCFSNRVISNRNFKFSEKKQNIIKTLSLKHSLFQRQNKRSGLCHYSSSVQHEDFPYIIERQNKNLHLSRHMSYQEDLHFIFRSGGEISCSCYPQPEYTYQLKQTEKCYLQNVLAYNWF